MEKSTHHRQPTKIVSDRARGILGKGVARDQVKCLRLISSQHTRRTLSRCTAQHSRVLQAQLPQSTDERTFSCNKHSPAPIPSLFCKLSLTRLPHSSFLTCPRAARLHTLAGCLGRREHRIQRDDTYALPEMLGCAPLFGAMLPRFNKALRSPSSVYLDSSFTRYYLACGVCRHAQKRPRACAAHHLVYNSVWRALQSREQQMRAQLLSRRIFFTYLSNCS